MAKKRTVSRKPARAKGATKRARSTADYSRLDTAPLQEHIKKRIKELEGKGTAKSGSSARQADDTLKRLRLALDTLQDICEPTMTLPI